MPTVRLWTQREVMDGSVEAHTTLDVANFRFVVQTSNGEHEVAMIVLAME
jgi:hypothetical protein